MEFSPLSRCILLALALITSVSAFAQQTEPNHGLKHWLTPDEAQRMKDEGKNFVETDPPTGVVRNIAEFGPMESVLVRYPFGIPISLIKEMAKDCNVTTIVLNASEEQTVRSIYNSNNVNLAHCKFIYSYTDTYWTRDYGPWFVTYGNRKVGIVDFKYNRPRPFDDDIPKVVADSLNINWFGMYVIHTGGNYMTDDHGQSSSTTLVWDENPALTHEQVASKMHDYLGIDNYMVVEDPNNTYIDHIDCWGKFLDVDKVLIRSVPPSHPQYAAIEATAAYYAAQISAYGLPFQVFRVNTPNNQPYTNSLILNKKVFVPIMGSINDAPALLAYQTAMPGYEIFGIMGATSTPWESTDALHCRANGLADRQMLFIDHMPISSMAPALPSFEINAEIVPFSNSTVYEDSTWLIWRVNGGTYDTLPMLQIDSTHWTGSIPGQMEGSEIGYYISSADAAGKHATCPYIGAPDPHVFQVAVSPLADITMSTDSLIYVNYQQMIDGQTATAYNYSQDPVTISFINPQGSDTFPWIIDPFTISLPYVLASGDSLDLTVKLLIPLNKRFLTFTDTLFITTAASTHMVFIVADQALYSGINPSWTAEEPLVSVYPNPFMNQTVISFDLKITCHLRMDICSSEGILVRTLADNIYAAGKQKFEWDGCNGIGKALPSGIYFYRIQGSGIEAYGKLALVR